MINPRYTCYWGGVSFGWSTHFIIRDLLCLTSMDRKEALCKYASPSNCLLDKASWMSPTGYHLNARGTVYSARFHRDLYYPISVLNVHKRLTSESRSVVDISCPYALPRRISLLSTGY